MTPMKPSTRPGLGLGLIVRLPRYFGEILTTRFSTDGWDARPLNLVGVNRLLVGAAVREWWERVS